MTKVPIIHNDEVVDNLPIFDNTMVNRQLMAADEIPVQVDVPRVMDVPIGGKIQHKGRDYTINTIPNVIKEGNFKYQYGITFESDLYRLYDKKLKHPTTRNKAFQYYGTPVDYAQLIVSNINEIDSDWTVGDCEDMPEVPIDFTGQTCRTALDLIAERFQIEWSVVGKEIRFVKQVGNLTSLVFEYGRGKGLYKLSYQYQDDKNIVTRAFGYGSSRNLPEGYRNGATQLMFDGEHLDANTELYGIREGDYENEDIYPQVDGVVSAVSIFDPESSTFQITDEALDFNLNDYFSALEPKISFKSGELQGQEFVIKKYDHLTKTIIAEVFQDGNDNRLPNATFQPAVGDKYTLFDMHLPDERVIEAENRLQAATLEWLNENCVPRVVYSLEMDPLYARDNGIYLNPGDKIRVIDTALGIDELIRVTKVSYPFVFPEQIPVSTKIVCEIANFIPYTTAERVISDTIDNKKDIKVVDRINAERARQTSLNMKTLAGRLFDPDGNLAKGEESLYAAMATFGFDSQNFSLVDVTIAANAGADPNALLVSGGKLVHYFYEVEGIGYEWEMSGGNWTGLDPAKFYYIYAKCSKTALTGIWEISESPVFANEIPGYWAFNLGQLFEVNEDGYRDFEFTKGMTYIVGDQIKTGKIQAMDGVSFVNLTDGTFNFENSEAKIAFTEEGVVLDGKIIATNAEFIDLLVQNLRTSPTGKRVQILASDNNIKIFGPSEEELVLIDDDSALEDTTYYTTIPVIPKPRNFLYQKLVGSEFRYYYANVGPGISAGVSGDDVNGFSSLGRSGVKTSGSIVAGNAEGTEYTKITQTGVESTGGIDVDGNGDVGGDLSFGGSLKTNGSPGLSVTRDVRVGGTGFIRMTFQNGILINEQAID